MKTILVFFILSIHAISMSYSQTYIINFAATGDANQIDSVKVENLTQNTTVNCNFGDELHLELNNSISDNFINNQYISVFPNPMMGEAEIIFFAKQRGNSIISILTLDGKLVLQMNKLLQQGVQKFQLSDLHQGAYFITISGESYFYTQKLISQNPTQGQAKIKYIENDKWNDKNNHLKSSKAAITMNYSTHDVLKFTGYANNLLAFVIDVPIESKTITFTFNSNCGQLFTDSRDGNVYQTIFIGNQCWMAENLKYLPSVVASGTSSLTIPYYYVHGYNGTSVSEAKASEKYSVYGVLYNWPAAMSGSSSSSSNPSGVQGVCPTGWHLPSDAEWTQLTDFLGGESIAGGKLKETGTAHWTSPNVGATNETVFTALPGGSYAYPGSFSNYRDFGGWWSATSSNSSNAYNRCIFYSFSDVYKYSTHSKDFGYSIRCIKD